MGVLRSAMKKDQLRIAVLPHQRADASATRHADEHPSHCRRAVKGQPILCGVLVEQPELVIVLSAAQPLLLPGSLHRDAAPSYDPVPVSWCSPGYSSSR